MKRILLIMIAVLALSATSAFAQAARPTDRFAWDTADAIAAAASYRWELELDGVVQTAALVSTCVAGTPVTCSAPIPAVTPSQHTIRIRAVDASVTTAPLVGPFSDPFTFTMRAVPAKPGVPRIVPGS